MKPKMILRSDALPAHIQAEMKSMQAALEERYGVAAHMVGAIVENLANVCAMIRNSGDMDAEQRVVVYDRSKDVCAEVLNVLGMVLQVNRDTALAVAGAYREFSARVEEEMLGADTLNATKDDAAAAIAKAAMH